MDIAALLKSNFKISGIEVFSFDLFSLPSTTKLIGSKYSEYFDAASGVSLTADLGAGDDMIVYGGYSQTTKVHGGTGSDVIWVLGGGPINYVWGDQGHDMIWDQSTNSNSIINCGEGNDFVWSWKDDGKGASITTGGGEDVLSPQNYSDGIVMTVKDFDLELDKIQLPSESLDFSDLEMSQDGTSAVIYLKNQYNELMHGVRLEKVDIDELSNDNFIFAYVPDHARNVDDWWPYRIHD